MPIAHIIAFKKRELNRTPFADYDRFVSLGADLWTLDFQMRGLMK